MRKFAAAALPSAIRSRAAVALALRVGDRFERERGDRGGVNRLTSPDVDPDVDHAASPTPGFMDVPVEQDAALVDRTFGGVALGGAAVAAVGEVGDGDGVVDPGEQERRRARDDVVEARVSVEGCPPIRNTDLLEAPELRNGRSWLPRTRRMNPLSRPTIRRLSSRRPIATSPKTHTSSSDETRLFQPATSASSMS